MSEPLPCPECGELRMGLTTETCRLQDGFKVRRLRHYKCRACDARFFDDEAMHRIQADRAKRTVARTVR